MLILLWVKIFYDSKKKDNVKKNILDRVSSDDKINNKKTKPSIEEIELNSIKNTVKKNTIKKKTLIILRLILII